MGSEIRSRILVVDDDTTLRMVLRHALERPGRELLEAPDGVAALDLLQARGAATLVLLDLRMPGMDGMEFLRRLPGVAPESRVIVLTAHGGVPDAVEALRLGAVDFLQKPFAPDELRELVDRVLDRDALAQRAASHFAEHLELARHFAQRFRIEAALEHVRRAIALDATRADAFNLLGVLEEAGGDSEGALRSYRVALELDPADYHARTNLWRASGRQPGRAAF